MATLEEWERLAPRPPRPRPQGYDWDVFLSYRSVDRRWVIQLYDALKLAGFEVFLDQYVLTPSQILVGGLQEGLSKSASGVMVWSTATADSKWCEREYLSMEARRTKNPDAFRYVVVKLDDAPLPPFAGDSIYLDFRDSPEGPRGVELLRLLYGVLGKPLPDGAVRLANEVDVETKGALAEVVAARMAGDRDRLVSLAAGTSLAWVTHPMLGCQAANALIDLDREDEALAILDGLTARFRESIRPKQLKGLALARKGDWARAQAALGPLVAAGERDPETLGIYARTWMDRYRASGNVLHLEMSRRLYDEAFKNAPHDYYPGLNAASKSVLLGEFDAAQKLADAVETIVGTEATPFNYWRSATAAEVQLIKRKFAAAARLYRDAVATAPEETGSHGSTWLQAESLMNALQPTPEERAQVASAFAHLRPSGATP